jgi:uncharacterized SAM-binding protein YcdF (DUF218 family)
MATSEAVQNRRPGPIILFVVILVTFSSIYVVGCQRAGNWLVKADIPPHADAIILLMGSYPERVLQAADLYHEGIADNLIIVYESMGPYKVLEARGASVIRTTEQARDAAVALGMPDSCITMLPDDARSTLDEALAVREYMTGKPGLDTLLLVSSPAHMRRAYMIFSTVLQDAGLNTYIGTSPSEYSSFNPASWWKRREDIQAVLSEWVKIASFVIFERGKIE